MSRQSHQHFVESDDGKPFPNLIDADPFGCSDVAAALARAQRRFEATFHHAPVGMAHVALDGRFLLVNPRFCEISGYDAQTLIRTGFQQITHPDDLNTDEALLARLHAGEFPRYTMEKRYVRSDGTTIWINLTVAMVRDEADRPEFYVAVIEDLSALRQANFEAVHDPLTGLLNRRGFACRARDMLVDAAQGGQRVGLLFLDLDGFKQLNDSRGHAAGDACLVDVARLLVAQAGGRDAVARVGGDEFLMLFGAADAPAAMALAERVRYALATGPCGVSGSIGLVTAPAAGMDDLDGMIARADDAMLAAKRAGRNQIRAA